MWVALSIDIHVYQYWTCSPFRCSMSRIHLTSWRTFHWKGRQTSLKSGLGNTRKVGWCQTRMSMCSHLMQTSEPVLNYCKCFINASHCCTSIFILHYSIVHSNCANNHYFHYWQGNTVNTSRAPSGNWRWSNLKSCARNNYLGYIKPDKQLVSRATLWPQQFCTWTDQSALKWLLKFPTSYAKKCQLPPIIN